jgi:general secretion pathway protein A
MYENFYKLTKSPFRITPDPEFLYLSPSHKEAVASIVYGVNQRKGFIVVVGEVGLGKTTILRRYLARCDSTRLSTAYIFNANVAFKDLLDTIYRELGIADKPDDVAGMVSRLHHVVIEEYRQRRNVVIVIDEAQNMPIETLENLRVLSNLESSTDKLIQIVLLGQPEFADRLELRELRQLKQRVAVRCTLTPFTDTESQAYIEHRLSTAGSSTSALFTPGAVRAIIKHARGIPRMLNVVCDCALVTGLGYRKKPVTAAIVREVIGDLEGRARVAPRRWWVWVPVAALLVLCAVLPVLAYWDFLPQGQDHTGSRVSVPTHVPAKPATASSPGPSPLAPLAPSVDGNIGAVGSPVPDAAALKPTEQPIVATRIVKQGDTLLQLALDVYGFPTDQVFERLVELNPGIANVNWIPAGTAIRFPDVSDLQARKQKAAVHRQQER